MGVKTRWPALLLAICLLVLCGCSRKVNKEESASAVQQTAETVQEAQEAKTGSDPAEEITISAENPTEKVEETAEETEKPAGNSEEPGAPELSAEPEAGTEAEAQPEASEKPEPTAEPEPVKEPVEPRNETAEAAVTASEAAPAEEEPESTPGVEEAEPEAAEPEASEPGSQRSIEITVPAKYADVRYRVGEVTWNPDDSATYRLTEEEHERLLADVQSDIQQELNEMCASPYFLDFSSIEANEDCTVFTVVCLSIETTMAEQESVARLFEYGRKFAAYEGREPGNIHIDYMTKIGNTFVTRDSGQDERVDQ